MIRVAVIGLGSMGRNHARVLHNMPGVSLVGVADTNVAVAEQLARLHGTRAYADYRQLISIENPHAVCVVVPTHTHFQVVRDVLLHGCHVLVEKPMTATLDEAQELIELSQSVKSCLMVGHIERYNPAIIELRDRLARGELGKVFQIHARRLGPFPERIRDVGVVVDLATHDLDVMRFLTGQEAVRVYAECKRRIHTTNEDMLTGLLHFEDETIGLLEVNWLTPTKIREIYVTGERGMFRADYLTQDLYFFENADATTSQWTPLSVLRGVSEGSMTRFTIRRREPLAAELEAFFAFCRGENVSVVGGSDGKAALQLAMALISSAQLHQVVSIPSDKSSRRRNVS